MAQLEAGFIREGDVKIETGRTYANDGFVSDDLLQLILLKYKKIFETGIPRNCGAVVSLCSFPENLSLLVLVGAHVFVYS